MTKASNLVECLQRLQSVIKFFPNEAANLEPVVVMLNLEQQVCQCSTDWVSL